MHERKSFLRNEQFFGQSKITRALSKELANYVVHQSTNLASPMGQIKGIIKYT